MNRLPITEGATERPVIFSAPMVQAIMGDRKTQTRRYHALGEVGDVLWMRENFRLPAICDALKPRELSWPAAVHYEADGLAEDHPAPSGLPWSRKARPNIHFPRSICRALLRITEVWTEELTDLSEADAISEGVTALALPTTRSLGPTVQAKATLIRYGVPGAVEHHHDDPRRAFQELWERISGPHSWKPDVIFAHRLERIA